MSRIALIGGALGATGLLVAGGLMAYSNFTGSSTDLARRAFQDAQTPQFEPVVARVNGSEIPGEWVALRLAFNAESLGAVPEAADAQETASPREILDSLIDLELAYQEAEQRGLACSDADVRELAKTQIDEFEKAAGDAGREYVDLWADFLGVPVDELVTSPQALESYARMCARGRLAQALAPPEARVDPVRMMQFWKGLYASLREAATIEILDPQLQ